MRNLQRAALSLVTIVSLLGLLATSPAAAASGTTVEVVGGALRITGTDGPETIHINQIDTGSYAVWVETAGAPLDVFNVFGVTGNVTIDTGAEADQILIGAAGPTSFPQSITIDPGDGLNKVELDDVTTGQDLTIKGRAVLKTRNTTIGDDLIGTSEAGGLSSQLSDTVIGDQYQLRSTRGGRIISSLDRVEVRRVSITGGPLADTASFRSSDLGANPRINLAGDDDFLPLTADVTWTGTLSHNAGAGDDLFLTNDEIDDGVPAPALLLGRLSVRLGTGDDEARLNTPLAVTGTVVDGQGGNDALTGLGVDDPATVANFRNFEDIDEPSAEPVTSTKVGNDLVVSVTAEVDDVFVDTLASVHRVAYRVESGGPLTVVDVTGITGDVTVDVAAGRPTIELGLNSPTDFAGDLVVKAGGSSHPRITNYESNVGGDLLINATGDATLRYQSVESDVSGRLDARATGNASVRITSQHDSFARVRINGANGDDSVFFEESDLGPGPNVVLRGGEDQVDIRSARWTGVLAATTGNGSDEFGYRTEGPTGRIRVRLGSGDDTASVSGPVEADGRGSRIQGDGGFDTLSLGASMADATIVTFENVIEVGA